VNPLEKRKFPTWTGNNNSLNFLQRLENQFWNDPWITHRFRKFTAGPKRWPWKNQREIKRQYQFTWVVNFGIGAFLSWPLAVWVGRQAQKSQGGLPKYPVQRFVHDFIDLDPSALARKKFRRSFMLTAFTVGVIFAYATTDGRQQRDSWYSRPDLKPFKAMVAQEEMDVTERTAYEAHY